MGNKLKIAIACFEYEGNSLSQKVDGLKFFKNSTLAYGKDFLDVCKNQKIAISAGIEVFKENNCKIIPILIAKAGSGGKVSREFYNSIKDKILNGIKNNLPLDGIFLSLHGAMICENTNDPEGDLLECIQKLVYKKTVISISLDLHAHVTNKMLKNSNIIVAYETYPHEDAYSTGYKAASLLIRTIKKEITPLMYMKKINALFPVLGGSTNKGFPMFDIRKISRKFEKEGMALSVSYFPVQPWLDFKGVGVTSLVITNNDYVQAKKIAKKILDEMWKRRFRFIVSSLSPNQAVEQGNLSKYKTIILVDSDDSIGGGSAGDSPSILKALNEKKSILKSLIYIVDPLVVKKAKAIGIKNSTVFKIGGYKDRDYHKPIEIKATIESFHEGKFIYEGGPLKGMKASMGLSVILKRNNLQILVVTNSVYEHKDEHYKCCNIDYRENKIVVFKNLMNFRKLLNDNTSFLIVSGGGATPLELDKVKWLNKKEKFWPKNNFQKTPFFD